MKIPPVIQASCRQNPRFGSNKHMFKMFNIMGDFSELGKSAVRHNQIIYAAVIASRIIFARSNNERMENARRDIPGWYFWFMGSPLMQAGIVRMCMPKAYQQLILTPTQEKATFLRKMLWLFVNPKRIWHIASDKQIYQRKEQIISDIINTAQKVKGKLPKSAINEINRINKMFTKTMQLRGLVSFIGFMFTVLTLGVGINFINMAFTRKNINKEKYQHNQMASGSIYGDNFFKSIPLDIPKPLSHDHNYHGHSNFVAPSKNLNHIFTYQQNDWNNLGIKNYNSLKKLM